MSTGTAPIRLGTRRSALALVQAETVAAALREDGREVTLVPVVTDGDLREPDTAWGEGAFVGALERALIGGEIDIAVHSAKDVPTDEDPGLRIAAYLPREDPADVLVVAPGSSVRGPEDLPAGARIGTDSPRRTAFLRAVRPDLVFGALHGNVDTRLRRLDDGAADALVLAAAGLRRLGRADRITCRLDPAVVPPAPGQGAIAVQARADDRATLAAVAALDDRPTRLAVDAERALLASSGGGCRAPIGALGLVAGDRLTLLGGFATADGSITVSATGEDAATEADGAAVAERVLLRLADLAADQAAAAGRPRVIVTRPRSRWAASALALVDRGLAPRSVAAIEIRDEPSDALRAAAADLARFDWVALTSPDGVRALAAAAMAAGRPLARSGSRPRWAVVGDATWRALVRAGVGDALRPTRATAAALAEVLPVRAGDRVLLPLGDLAAPDLADRLSARGARVTTAIAYRTVEAPDSSLPALAAALYEGPRAWLASSPSAVRGLLALAGALGVAEAVRALPVVAIGPTTSAEVVRLGLSLAAEAPSPDPGTVAETVAGILSPVEIP
ncbi:MAG TPA: hydroxymethylbilane synthase [Candidatus Limnocylindrales bacterium]|nr:hydroxymethylbilane synthase [Candidatus Limnocylindrales bacterium]